MADVGEEELIVKVDRIPESSAKDSDILLLHSEFGKLDDKTDHSQVFHSVAPSLNGEERVDNSLSNEFDPPEVVDDSDDENSTNNRQPNDFKLKYWTGEIFEEQRGRNLFFEDGVRRIDYILVFPSKYKTSSDEGQNEKKRNVFERNLEEEGLELEHDIVDGREVQYTKVHAPWEVLVRYAEIMKTRMPIKEIPDEIKSQSMWEIMSDYMSGLLSPFQLDPAKVPPVPKKFTHVFERDKSYLFAVPERKEMFFSHAARSRITDYILRRKKYSDADSSTFSFGIKRLISMGTYSAAYPLHEGSWKPWTRPSMRRLLFEHWAYWRNWYKVQPLDYIRVYYGEKIGLYFAWLGYYTYMLIPASFLGLAVFIYGLVTIDDNILAKESCDWNNNFTMCPLCNKRCPYWNYAAVCTDVWASHMFDNAATVAFSIFMALWGTVYLEFWKREEASIQFKWNLLNFQEEEEPPRPEYLMRLSNSKFKKKHKISGVRSELR